MIQWGGSQNGVLEKFDNALGSYCLTEALTAVLDCIEKPQAAIEAALKIPGLGLTYASKRIRKALTPPLPKIFDGNTGSMVRGYCAFTDYLRERQQALEAGDIALAAENGVQARWRPAEIEMALFQRASAQNGEALSNEALQATAKSGPRLSA
jgi:hypothetical protein